MGFLRKVIGSPIKRAVDNTVKVMESGQINGGSQWGRYANNISGASGTAGVIKRWRTGGHAEVSVNDARTLRPALAMSNANDQLSSIAADAVNRDMAVFQRQRDAEDTRARLAQQVRIRRAGRGGAPTTHGGTLVTGALGLPGTTSPERGTKLGQ